MTSSPAATGLRARWRRARHSLGTRLIVLFVLLALAVTVTFLAGMRVVLQSGWKDYARPLVADYTDALVAQIGTPPDVAKAEAIAARLPLRIRIEGPVVNWSSMPDSARDQRPRAARDQHGDRDRSSTWRPSRLLADGHRITFGLRDATRDDAADDEGPPLIGWVTLAVLLLLTALAYAMVRHWLRPLREIRAGAIRYGQGDFSNAIGHRHADELGDLADHIDRMATSLQHMLDNKRQLLLAISHELRSPLTRARLNAELVDGGDARDALLRDLAQMRDLIIDLLESERLAGGHSALHTEEVDLNALLAELLATDFAGRELELDLRAEPTMLALDPSRIRLLVRNLLGNALRHNSPAAPPPRLSTWRDAGSLVIAVRDHGPGVAEAELPRLAEAFYRPDAARERGSGGVGLGLYLCRLVAEAHGGRLMIHNARPGLSVEAILPGC